MCVYLVALRYVVWDLVPASALHSAQWWKRHVKPLLLVGVLVTVGSLAGSALVGFAD